MVQGGCPDGTGAGGPGYSIPCETKAEKQYHDVGVLSMAHRGRNTGGSQFFICHGTPSFLNGQYTVFGQLIKGDDVLEKIATGATEGPDRPVKRVTIESVKIVAADSIK